MTQDCPRHYVFCEDLRIRHGQDAASGDCNSQMRLAGAGPPDQHDVALLGDESAAGKLVDKGFVNRRARELEVVEVLGEWQLSDGELLLDRASDLNRFARSPRH
jgi:hypothetical protein